MFADKLGSRAGLVGALLLASIASTGCVVETGAPPPPVVVVDSPGRLMLRWTIHETVDPGLCVVGRAAAIDIVVTTAATAQHAGEFQAPCSAFATSLSSLYPGTYVADAFLIDSSGRPRTTSIQVDPFTLFEGSELVIYVDFPSDSFLDGLQISSKETR